VFLRGGEGKNMRNRQIDSKTKQVRINRRLHQALKILASEEGKTMKAVVEESLISYGVEEGGENP